VEGATGNINITPGTQFEVAIECFSDAQGTVGGTYVNSTFVTIASDGSFTANQTFTQPASPTTTTTLTASSPDFAGQNITLTATVTGGLTSPAQGTVTFTNGGTAIANGTNVPLVNGVATLTTQFAAPGTESLAAAFTSTTPASWTNSSGTNNLVVTTAPSNAIPLTVNVPTSGSFTLTVGTTAVALTATGLTATGTIPNGQVSVNDTRNTFPGWIVSGQDSAWTGSGSAAGGTFSGNQLGWTPTLGTVAAGVTAGPTVAPAGPGLGTTAAVLASVPHGSPNGFGVSNLGATLNLAIPTTAPAGPYSSSLSITAVESN
jgi:hypothetical protein